MYGIPFRSQASITFFSGPANISSKQAGVCFVTEYGKYILCICLEDKNYSEWKSHRKLVAFLGEYIGHVGISNRYNNLTNTSKYIKEAKAALLLGEKRDPTFWCYSFSDYAYEYALHAACSELPVEELIPSGLLRLKERDSSKDSELLHTLEIYIRLKCNGKAAADQLFIHRTTFQYRMKLIKEIIGLDVQDEENYKKLLLAFELLRMSDS